MATMAFKRDILGDILMGKIIKVSTQIEFEVALKQKVCEIELLGSSIFVVASGSPTVVSRGRSSPRVESWGSSSPRVESWGSSSPTVVSRGSSSPTVVSMGSSSPRVESWESSSPRVESWESSSPRVESRGSSSPTVVSMGSSSPTVVSMGRSSPRVESWGSSSPTVVSWESSSPTGSVGKFSILVLSVHDKATANIPGATILPVLKITTPAEWCEYYGATVEDNAATLYKAVNDNYCSDRGFSYAIGSTPEAPDWDGPARECGGGLHFCSTPSASKNFYVNATKFVECKVLLEDLVVHENAIYPTKVKGRRVCAPIVEVDIDGNPVALKAE